MKKLILILFLGLLLASCNIKKEQFTITGNIDSKDSVMIFLQKRGIDGWEKLDSTKVINGKFNFTGSVVMPEMWYLTMDDKKITFPLFVENSDINVQLYPDSIENSKVLGSSSQDIYKKYVVMNDTLMKKMEDVYNAWKTAKEIGDTAVMKKYDTISEDLDKELKDQLISFIKSNNKYIQVNSVKSGEKFWFKITLSPNNIKYGVNKEYFSVVQEGLKHIENTSFCVEVTVK